jgi:hypothetical protein
MNVRWLRVPLLGVMTSLMMLAGSSVAQAQPRYDTRVIWRDGHRVVVRVGDRWERERWERRHDWDRHHRYQRYYYYDRWHHRHDGWR